MLEILMTAVVLGTGATAILDTWGLLRRKLFGIPGIDYRLVGRWFAHLARGRVLHPRIAESDPVAGERALGWIAHYVIGIVFAALLPLIWGMEWVRDPAPLPALAVGITTAAAPFFIMQPGMGLGIAARLAPRPMFTRIQTLVTHAVFGLGLYLTASAVHVAMGAWAS